MPANTTTGARTIWAFIWEDDNSYAQDPGEPADDDWKPFGDREQINEPDSSNQSETLYRPGSRVPSRYLEGGFDGSWGVDFIYTNPYWMGFVLGEPEVDENNGEYTLTYEESQENPPRSAHLIEETHYSDGTVEHTVYVGAVVDDPDIDVGVDDVVDVSLSGAFATEFNYELGDSPYDEIGDQPDTNFCPLHFGNADLYIDIDDDGSAERMPRVQQLTFNFNTTVEPEYELGTRFAVVPSFLALEPNVQYNRFVSDDSKSDERRSFYGSLENDTPAESFCDGSNIAGRVELFSRKSDEVNEARFMWNESFPESYQRTNTGDPESALEDDVERNVLDISVTATIDEEPR